MGGGRLVEDGDVVYAAEGCQELGALVLRDYGAARAFVATNGGVGVEADQQDVAEGAGGLKVAHVAYVEHVEGTVGEDDTLAFGAPLPAQGDEFGQG